MKNGVKLKWQILLLIFSIFVFSCKDNDLNSPIDTPPEVPPAASFKMEFDNFPNTVALPKVSESNFTDTSNTKNHWGYSYLNGVFWQTLVKVGMAIPVAAFIESFNHEAEQQEDGKWMWAYSFAPLGGVNHTASLYANVDNDGVTWEMYISKGSQFTDFLWFSGQSDLAVTEGTWTIFHEPNNPSPWIGIQWHRNPVDGTADIKYTNIEPNSNENGGYIYYGTNSDGIYNAFYEIYNKGKDNTTSIKWNIETHEGQVRDLNHFGDNNWHCWDSNLDDIDCP
jgi:hypothetical protein